MASAKEKFSNRTWTKDSYIISTDPALIPIAELNAAFASETIYWSDTLPEDVWRETLNNSLCFGIYEVQQKDSSTPLNDSEGSNGPLAPQKFIGLGRCVTDFVTFLYLTDVWVDPSHQGKGHGAWLMSCVQEIVEEMPYLRRSLLFTGDWKRSVPFYERLLKMSIMECKKPVNGEEGQGIAVMQWKGPAHPDSR